MSESRMSVGSLASLRKIAQDESKKRESDLTCDAGVQELRENPHNLQQGETPGRGVADMQAHLDNLHAGGLTVGQCIDLFLTDLKQRVECGDLSWRTLKWRRESFAHIPADLRSRPIEAVRKPEIKAWHRTLAMRRGGRDQHQLTGAADAALKAVSALWAWVDDEQLAIVSPCITRRIRRLHEVQGARALDGLELETWRRALDIHEHARTLRVRMLEPGQRKARPYNPTVALRLLDLTGARSSEIRELRIEDIKIGPGRPRLELSKTKTGMGRTRPLSAAAVEVIQQQLARLGQPTAGFLFPSATTKQGCMSDSCLERCYIRVAKIAEIEGTSRHSLRKSMVSEAMARGFSSTGTAGVAGHSEKVSFDIYRKCLPGESFDVVEAHAKRTKGAA